MSILIGARPIRSSPFRAAVIVACLCGSTVAAADPWPPPIPRYRLLASSTFVGSYNPEGVEENLRLGAQMLLYRSGSPIFRDNFVFVGTIPRLNPVSIRAGAAIEVQPLTIFNLRFNVEYMDYFGSFKSVQSFPSPLSDISKPLRERNGDLGLHYGVSGMRVSISPQLVGAVGPVVVRDRFTLEYVALDLKNGDTAYYDPIIDTMSPGRGLVLYNDLDVFFLKDLPAGGFFSHGRIIAGARYTVIKPMFNRTDYVAGDDPSKERNEIQRVGPLVAFSIFDDGYTRFHEPTLVALVQFYAAHPNRTGKDEHQAVPYLVLAFVFQSDLWTSGPAPAP